MWFKYKGHYEVYYLEQKHDCFSTNEDNERPFECSVPGQAGISQVAQERIYQEWQSLSTGDENSGSSHQIDEKVPLSYSEGELYE